MEEIEVKFLEIDVDQTEKKLTKLGAVKKFERLYKVRVFDYPDLHLNKMGAWIRLRDEGDKIMLAYKERLGFTGHAGEENDKGMKEIEIAVSDFDKTAEFLISIGLKEKFSEEKRRTRYMLENIEFDIDEAPALKPYLEIEAKSWDEIDRAIKLLGLNPADKKIFSAYQVYQLAGINQNDYSVITFAKMVKKEEK